MAKKIIQDILIRRPSLRREPKIIEERQMPKTEVKKSGFLKKIFWLCIIVIALFLTGVILVNFSTATIKITPHQEFKDIDKTGVLKFETIKLEQESSQNIPATGIAVTSQKARGQIVVYNTYSASSQRLLDQTRFETPDGKIYKIQEAVVLPGNGSLEVTVYADEAGPEYNMGLSDFTIPGFRGTARYEKIYARSKTEMTGGAEANSAVVTQKDIDDTRNSLRQKIETFLREKINQQIPSEYLLYENALEIDFSDNISDNFLKETGVATGFLLKKSDLSKFLADNKENVSVVNLEELDFNLLSKNADETEINFSIKGRAHLVWDIDENSLADALMGVKDKGYQNIFKNYPDIERAEIIFKPMWWPWMPNNKSRIHFETIFNE